MLADNAGDRGCRQNAAASDDDAPEAIRRRHAKNDLERLAIMKSSVAAQHERLALMARKGVENRLDEIFKITRLKKFAYFLAQARRAGPLILEWLGGDGYDLHRAIISAKE